MRTRVCIVGMLDSVHLARWLAQFANEPIDFLLLGSSPHRRPHPILKSLLSQRSGARYRTIRPLWLLGAPVWITDKLLGNRLKALLLLFIVKFWRPNYVHALELQNAGYIVLRYRTWMGHDSSLGKFLVTNYGSDIFWFSRFSNHRKKLEKLLESVDSYSCECERDVRLARELGFEGEVMPVYPNAGGFSAADLSNPSATIRFRQTIAIKGYQGWVGRANTALDAIDLIADRLHDYQIELYSCNRSTIRRAKRLQRDTGLRINYSRKGRLRHEQVLQLFYRSAIYVGISESDGISTSLLEAMACGAIPVQTSTACCDEWFTDTGVRVDTISPEAVAEAILAALELAKDPSNAEKNRQTIREKASEEQVKAAALQYYR